ncbi:MAG: O-acetylhomoserine aminocarboxypropyltransferase/cysteine synthase family protein [Canibacter sp.]
MKPEYNWDGYDFWTREVHAGEYPDENSGLRVPPIAMSAGYVFEDFDDSVNRFSGASGDRIYSRQGNPTNAVAEARLTSLEGGSETVLASSGQAAISAALFAIAGQGDHIVSTASVYGGTRILFGRSFKRFGIEFDYVWDSEDDAEWDAKIHPNTKAIYCETIPNPLNDITDMRRIAEVAKRHDLPIIVDNTVGTPALIRPGEFGAHIVVHSTTKFLTGHGAAVSGAIVDLGTYDWENSSRSYPLLTDAAPGRKSLLERFGNPTAYAHAVRDAVVNDIGLALSPMTGFLLHQGMETLSLRMERHTRSSEQIAQWLTQQPEVERVDYAGLESSELHDLAKRDYPLGTSSVFGLTVRGGIDEAREFVNGLRVWSRMTGIGDTRSMIIHPKTSTHATFSDELNARLGVTDGLLRLSVGLESPNDLIRDLRSALDQISKP